MNQHINTDKDKTPFGGRKGKQIDIKGNTMLEQTLHHGLQRVFNTYTRCVYGFLA